MGPTPFSSKSLAASRLIAVLVTSVLVSRETGRFAAWVNPVVSLTSLAADYFDIYAFSRCSPE